LKKNLKIYIFTISGLVILLFVVLNFQRWDEHYEKQYWESPDRGILHLHDSVLNKIESGDLVFRRGHGWISDVIARYSQSGNLDLSHVGIIIKNEDQLKVFHAISNHTEGYDGIIEQPFEKFLNHCEKNQLLIIRLKDISQTQKKQIELSIHAWQLVNPTFDSQWDWKDSSELYCSEFVIRVLSDSVKVIQLPKDQDSVNYFFMNLNELYNYPNRKVIYSTFH
jgi:hypothetical protein